MQTYINKYWNENGRKRFPEATTVCFAVADGDMTPDLGNWQPTDEPVPANMDKLFVEAGIHYYGFL